MPKFCGDCVIARENEYILVFALKFMEAVNFKQFINAFIPLRVDHNWNDKYLIYRG